MGIRDWAEKKENERREREWADSDYRIKEYNKLKNIMFMSYRNGSDIHDSKNCKGNINNSYSNVAIFVPSFYQDEFYEYVKKDPKFMEILSDSGSKSSENSGGRLQELIEALNEKRKEKDIFGLVIIGNWLCFRLTDSERESIKSYLSNEEKEFIENVMEILKVEKDSIHEDFVNYLKKWYFNNEYEYAYDILSGLETYAELISEEELDDIKNYEPVESEEADDESKDSEKSESSDVSDIKSKLEKLKTLKEEGLISEEDFEKKKSALLDSL